MCSLPISFLLEVTKYQRRKKLQEVEGTVHHDGGDTVRVSAAW